MEPGRDAPVTDSSVSFPSRKTNSGRRGVWVYNISGTNILAGLVPTDASTTEPTSTVQSAPTTEAVPEENEDFSTETPLEFQPRYPEAEVIASEYGEPDPESGGPVTEPGHRDHSQTTEPLSSPVGSTVEPREPPRPPHAEPGVPPVDPLQSRYLHPDSARPQTVTVDEDEDLDLDGNLPLSVWTEPPGSCC